MGKHLVIVGAGHAHLTVLKNLKSFQDAGHRVTVVSSSALHYYSGMGPGMLSGIYRPEEIRFNVKRMSEDRGAAFVEDNVVQIHPRQQKISLHSGTDISYDVLSLNTGSYVPSIAALPADESVFTVKPIEKLLAARRRITDAKHRLRAGRAKLITAVTLLYLFVQFPQAMVPLLTRLR